MSKIGSFLVGQGKGLSLLFTMLIGVLVPQAYVFTYLIQYLLMMMLFFAFLDIEFKFQRSVLWVLLANVAVAFIAYWVLVPFNLMLALAAFMTAIAPTAIAAPVIISFVQREVEYVVASVVLTNVASAFVVPIALPFLIGTNIQISVWEVLQPVLVVMFVPLILAQLVKALPSATQGFIRKGKAISFPIWLINLFIISANASNFLRNDNTDSSSTLAIIACDLHCQFWCGSTAWWSKPLAGGESVTRAEEPFICYLDRADLHQSACSARSHVLHPVSPYL